MHEPGSSLPSPARQSTDEVIAHLVTVTGAGPGLAEMLRRGVWVDEILDADDAARARSHAYHAYKSTVGEALRGRSREELRAAGLWIMLTLERRGRAHAGHVFLWDTSIHEALVVLARRKLGWTQPETILLWWQLARLVNDRAWEMAFAQLLRLPLSAAEELTPEDLGPLRPTAAALRDVTQELDWIFADTAERLRFTRRLRALLDHSGDGGGDLALAENVLAPGDEFGPGARAELTAGFEPAVVVPLLRHLADYSGSVTPAKAWRARLAALLAEQPPRADAVRLLLERACAHKDATIVHNAGTGSEWEEPGFVIPETAQLLRAAVWAARDSDADWAPTLLGQVAVHCGSGLGGLAGMPRCAQVASSAVAALGELDGDLAVSQLSRIQSRVRNKTLLKAVGKALTAAADRAGITAWQLVERSVPTFGLTAGAPTERAVGEHTAVLSVDLAAIRLTWRNAGGREVRSVPRAVREQHAEALAELRATTKEAGKILAGERLRLENLLATARTWAGADWARYYLDHPLTGVLAAALLWQVRPSPTAQEPAGWLTGLPARQAGGWSLRTVEGDLVAVPEDAQVRLWHPIRSRAADVAAWREHLTTARLQQPFKQAFREVYLLTPAEESTGTYSNRFAGHILRYRQAGALMRARGWAGNHLGYWDGGNDGETTREFGDDGWRARFYYDLVENDADAYSTPSLCASDQVRFERLIGNGARACWSQVSLTEVPALVFTEAMRDVDLFVGVASIAADPEWEDRGEGRYRDYWYRTSFGDLNESAQMRRTALARLMPRTKIADRVRVTDRFLEVDGSLHTYKIHLGSGNILMSPNDAYLCVVAGRGAELANRVFLPFEEDGGLLSIIVSKAFLLADDARITDPSITRQLRAT